MEGPLRVIRPNELDSSVEVLAESTLGTAPPMAPAPAQGLLPQQHRETLGDSYFARVLKLIPAEALTVHTTGIALIGDKEGLIGWWSLCQRREHDWASIVVE